MGTPAEWTIGGREPMSKRRGSQHRKRTRPGRVTLVQVGRHLVCEHIAQDLELVAWIEDHCDDPSHAGRHN